MLYLPELPIAKLSLMLKWIRRCCFLGHMDFWQYYMFTTFNGVSHALLYGDGNITLKYNFLIALVILRSRFQIIRQMWTKFAGINCPKGVDLLGSHTLQKKNDFLLKCPLRATHEAIILVLALRRFWLHSRGSSANIY